MTAHAAAEALEPRRFRAIAVAVAIVTLIGVLPMLADLPVHVSHDFGEGWNAYWAHTAITGGPLYAIGRPYVADNYPPLFFYLDGAFGRLIGDDIIAGRILALIAELVVAVEIVAIVRMLGGERRWAAMAGLAFLFTDIIFFSQFTALNNPQWPGQAVMLAGLLPLLRPTDKGFRSGDLVLSAVTICVGGLIKHNQIALPLAVALWLLARDRRAFAWWAGTVAVVTVAACAALYALYGRAVFVEILGFRRVSDLHGLIDGVIRTAELLPLIVAAVWAWRRQRRDDARIDLLALFALFATIGGAAQRLGAGVYINAHFDALIALHTLAGSLPARSAAGLVPAGERGPRRMTMLGLILLPGIALSPVCLFHVGRDFVRMRENHAVWAEMIASARAAPGPVACEYLAVCYWAGQPLEIDFFAYGQKLRTGEDPRPLEAAIRDKRFAVMIVDRGKRFAPGTGRLPLPFPQIIDAAYAPVVETRNHITLMRPR